MRLTLAISAILFAALASEPPAAWGQMGSSGMSGSSGMFGSSRSFGSGLSAGQSSAFGSSFGSSFGSGMGGSSFGSMGGNSFGGGGNSFGSMGGSSFGSMGGNSFGGQSPFVGVNQQQLSGRGFVGANQLNGAGMNPGMSGLGSGGMQGLGMPGMQGMGNRASSMYPNDSGQYPNGQGNMPGNGRGGVTIRTVLSVNFEPPAVAAPRFNSVVSKRLADLPAIHWRSPNQVEIRGRTAILRGVVATEHDRDLAERVARLEASVDQVDNQLVVASSPSKPAKAAGAADKPAASH